MLYCVESQIFFINNYLMPESMTRINDLARGFASLQRVAYLNDSVLLSLRLWFQKLKITRLRKDKSFSVWFRKSKPNKIYASGFWSYSAVFLEWTFWALVISLLDCWSCALQPDFKPSLCFLSSFPCIPYVLKYTLYFPIFCL